LPLIRGFDTAIFELCEKLLERSLAEIVSPLNQRLHSLPSVENTLSKLSLALQLIKG
jgi:hypothetical protein